MFVIEYFVSALSVSEPPYICAEEFLLVCLSQSLRYAQEMHISKRIKAAPYTHKKIFLLITVNLKVTMKLLGLVLCGIVHVLAFSLFGYALMRCRKDLAGHGCKRLKLKIYAAGHHEIFNESQIKAEV